MSPRRNRQRQPGVRADYGRLGRWSGGLGMATIGYVLVGYPLVLLVWSRLKGERLIEAMPLQPVSVIISAHNEAAVIGAKLASIAAGDYPMHLIQLIVSDDGSTDGTADVVRAVAPSAEVLRVEQRSGKMGAMRRGMALARHDIVIFTDAENTLGPASLRELVAPFADPTVGAVNGAYVPAGGSETVSKGERVYWRYEDAIKRAEANVGSLTSILGALLAVRAELVPTLPEHLINDDFYLGMHVARCGRRVAYAPRAVTSESGAASLQGEATRRVRMTAGRWQTVVNWRDVLPIQSPMVMWQVVSHKYLRLLLPAAMAAALLGALADVVGAKAQGRTARWSSVALGVQVAGYTLAATANHVPASFGTVRSLAQAARYVVRSNAASAEGFWGFVSSPDQLALWDRVEKVTSPG